ncbi:hypothetical protein E4198_00035 [Streptomyces sp. RKND-216]|uniref:hypothetical protein n=1 Tax=Streptomyces sp. RKND-216 TaxID=2562581 RepID=UPI00109DC023|nr:hypothetical protein [Streptomyces sp. RKND-216]THA28239.1 hypothetical protein E4198_00035 [Streptomyces sp. RKND-216]
MTPRRRRTTGGRGRRQTGQPGEAARLTQELLNAGYTKRDVGRIIGRNPSLVSQFFTKGKGASYVEGLRAAVQEMQVGAATGVDELKSVAQPHIGRRLAKGGNVARVRGKDVIATPGKSRAARAAKQHIASGASRLRPVVEGTAADGGKLAFTVRAKKGAFLIGSGRRNDSPGIRRGVVQRRDGTEERSYGASAGPGFPEDAGFDAVEWQNRVEAAGGDVAQAVRDWMVTTGRLAPDAQLTHLEVRGWKPTV